MPIGEIIRTIRLQRGLSQNALAALAEVNQSTVWHLECTPGYRPRWEVVCRVAEALCVGLDFVRKQEGVKT